MKATEKEQKKSYALDLLSQNKYEGLVILIEELHDTNFEPKDFNLSNGLCRASFEGRVEVVKYLVEQGADVHAEENESLRWASEEEHTEIVDYIQEVLRSEKEKK